MSLIVPFVCVFGVAMTFTLLTIVRQTKFSVIYATFSTVCWGALAGLNLLVFPTAYFLSWLYVALAIIIETIGLVYSLLLLKADREEREMQI